MAPLHRAVCHSGDVHSLTLCRGLTRVCKVHRAPTLATSTSVVCLAVWWARPRHTRNPRMSPAFSSPVVLALSGLAVGLVCLSQVSLV